MRKYMIVNCSYSIVFALLCGSGIFNNISWWIILTIGIVPAIISSFVTLIINKKSYISENTEELKKLYTHIGLNDKQSLRISIMQRLNTVLKNIGKDENSKTLTGQHEDIKVTLDKEISLIEKRYTEEEKRINNFTLELHNTLKAINEFKMFIASWEKTTTENNDLKLQVIDLSHKLEALQNENHMLKQKIHIKNHNHHKDDIELE